MSVSTQNMGEIRLSKVISYISENFDQEISLDEIADIASMTVQSFCRYFKKRTNKTFIQFLNEYRIGKACVLLIENKIPIGQIWNLNNWEDLLRKYQYWDVEVVSWTRFGWPISFHPWCSGSTRAPGNHASALQFPNSVDRYIEKELAKDAIHCQDT